MVRRLKWIGCFTSVLFVVLFGLAVSPKAKAVNVSIIAQPTGVSWDFENGKGMCQRWDDTNNSLTLINTIGSGWCFADSNALLTSWSAISSSDLKPTKEGNYYVFTFYTMSAYNDLETVTWNIANYTDNFALIDYQLKWQGNSEEYCRVYEVNQYNNYACKLGVPNYAFKVRQWQVILQAKHTGNYTIGIGRYNERNELLRSVYGGTFTPAVRLASIEEYSPLESTPSYLESQKQDDENQGTQSNTDSDQAGQDVDGATTNLLSAITGFFGAFTSASATTCQTDWGIEGFRNFDFCGTQVPTELRVVFTIVASIIFIPMIWFLITSILNAFKEFQQ